MVLSASVGDTRAVRMAGSRPATAPIKSAAPNPPAQAVVGTTMAHHIFVNQDFKVLGAASRRTAVLHRAGSRGRGAIACQMDLGACRTDRADGRVRASERQQSLGGW